MGHESQGGDLRRESEATDHAKPEPDENRTRERAHEIWVEEGKPEGRAIEHWLQARWELQRDPGPVADFKHLDRALEAGDKPG